MYNFAIFSIILLLVASSVIGSDTKWGYISPTGPANWASMDSKWAVCGNGSRQSPINIITANTVYYNSHINYYNVKNYVIGTLKNNGHTVEYEITSTCNSPQFVVAYEGYTGDTYELLQFHFHWGSIDSQGSEHNLNGRAAPAEVNFVAKNTKYSKDDAGKHGDGYLVIGVVLSVCDASDFNSVFGVNNVILDQLHYSPDEVTDINVRLEDIIYNIIYNDKRFFIYQGSITIPPCSEAVIWSVSASSLCITRDQLNLLRNQKVSSQGPALVDNFRPVQQLDGRTVYIN